MIPPFDATTGNLPPGIHEATWEEVMIRFGYTVQRRRLLSGLEKAVEALRMAGCRRCYLDGSFVTTKELPNDFDACWETDDVDLNRLARIAPQLFDLDGRRTSQKLAYGGELFPADLLALPSRQTFLQYFQLDKHTGQPKGIIALTLDVNS